MKTLKIFVIFGVIFVIPKKSKNLYKYISHEAKFTWAEFYG